MVERPWKRQLFNLILPASKVQLEMQQVPRTFILPYLTSRWRKKRKITSKRNMCLSPFFATHQLARLEFSSSWKHLSRLLSINHSLILLVDFLKWQFSFLLNRFCFLWQFFWLQPQYAYDPIYICTFFPIHPRQIWPLATWMVTALVGFPFLLGKLQFLSKNGKVSFYFSILESTSVYIVRISSH